jgi:hypothetical protein
MSETEETTLTHHAMLVAWGQFAHCIGLIERLMQVILKQKTIVHKPQTKVLEFFVSILAGFQYLKDISQSEHPLDKDGTVARSWGQSQWADHSGVSRTLHSLSEVEVANLQAVLEEVEAPFLEKEVVLAAASGRLELDADLTPRPVSNTSKTYPEAEFGHMDDRIRLGYQAAIVSMKSPTYGRLGLSAEQHSGNVVANTQAEALVLAAERRLKACPRRRTELLEARIETLLVVQSQLDEKVTCSRESLAHKQTKLQQVVEQLAGAENIFQQLQGEYNRQERPERPYSKLAKARKKLEMLQKRWQRSQNAFEKGQEGCQKQLGRALAHQEVIHQLRVRLTGFQQDNAQNSVPLQMVIRLDAGFGTAENIALLVEMGYEIYTKPHGNWLKGELRKRRQVALSWQRVGKNAEMVAWKQVQLDGCPYPLDLACERFWTGKTRRHSGLLHFGDDPVCDDLADWFHFYNARQTIEAGNKELRQVFEAHHLKVRARPALRLQEHFALFAANFVRYASLWLAEQCPQVPDGWKVSTQPRIKQQVKVGAHTSAWVSWMGQDCLLRFSDLSVFAGRSFEIKRQWAFQPVLPFLKSCFFSPT